MVIPFLWGLETSLKGDQVSLILHVFQACDYAPGEDFFREAQHYGLLLFYRYHLF
jgi:hypothetical protein